MIEVRRCPACRRPIVWEGNPSRPFCSERCRTLDLGNWAAERYRIPIEEPDDEDGPKAPEDEDGER